MANINNNKKTTKTKKTTPKKTITKKVQKEETAIVPKEIGIVKDDNDFGEWLFDQDKYIASFIAQGKTDEEVKTLFKVDDAYLAKLRSNPNFVKLYNDKVMSTGMANKVERVAKAKRALNTLAEEFFKKVENGDLEKQNITTVWRMMQEAGATLQNLLGENKVVDQNITITLKDEINKKNRGTVESFDDYNPSDRFKVIDVTAEEIKD